MPDNVLGNFHMLDSPTHSLFSSVRMKLIGLSASLSQEVADKQNSGPSNAKAAYLELN